MARENKEVYRQSGHSQLTSIDQHLDSLTNVHIHTEGDREREGEKYGSIS